MNSHSPDLKHRKHRPCAQRPPRQPCRASPAGLSFQGAAGSGARRLSSPRLQRNRNGRQDSHTRDPQARPQRGQTRGMLFYAAPRPRSRRGIAWPPATRACCARGFSTRHRARRRASSAWRPGGRSGQLHLPVLIRIKPFLIRHLLCCSGMPREPPYVTGQANHP